MIYVYYDIDDDRWYRSKYKENWVWYDEYGKELFMDMEDPKDNVVVPVDIAERWVWCRMNVPGFEIQVIYINKYDIIKGWVFLIPSEEDAMHFKLRWGIE